MALFGTPEVLRSQLANAAHFARAFAFVAECRQPGSAAHAQLANLAAGESARVELSGPFDGLRAGGAFGILQAYLTKDRHEGRWETHRRYIDVQAVVDGEEFMEVADRGQLTVSEDMTPGQDAIFYRPFDRGSILRMNASVAAIYFPSDAHLGGVAIGKPALVRKVVVKVPVP